MSKQLRSPGLWLVLAITAALCLWPALVGFKASARETAFTILRAVAFASSLNILLGYTGYVSFGHIVFLGLGGYVGLFLIDAFGVHLVLAILAGGLSAGILAFLLGNAILRLRGAYFALATIGVNEAMRAFIKNFDLFGSSVGITLHMDVYKPYGGYPQAGGLYSYIGVAVLTLAVVLVSYLVKTSRFGLGLLAIRENEDAAEVMGVVAPSAKTWAYVLSAVFPGMLGVILFFKNGNVEPGDAFVLHQSIEGIVMVMLGGYGTVLGPLLGATAYQRLRGLLLVSPLGKIHLAVAGVLLLIIVLFVPAGVVGWLRSQFARLRRVLV